MTKTITIAHPAVMGAVTKSLGDGRMKAFRDNPCPETVAAIVSVVEANLTGLYRSKPGRKPGKTSATAKAKADTKKVLTSAADKAKKTRESDKAKLAAGKLSKTAIKRLSKAKLDEFIKSLKKGGLVMARYAEDGEYYEAEVQKMTKGRELITVKFTEDGVIQSTHDYELRPVELETA